MDEFEIALSFPLLLKSRSHSRHLVMAILHSRQPTATCSFPGKSRYHFFFHPLLLHCFELFYLFVVRERGEEEAMAERDERELMRELI